MKQVIVEMADADMRTLKRVARHLSRGPAELLQEQVKSLVASKRISSVEAFKLIKRSRRLKAITPESPHLLKTSSALISQPADLPATPTFNEQDAARERRLQILRRTSGLMKNHPDFPQDGLQYQNSVRGEWE